MLLIARGDRVADGHWLWPAGQVTVQIAGRAGPSLCSNSSPCACTDIFASWPVHLTLIIPVLCCSCGIERNLENIANLLNASHPSDPLRLVTSFLTSNLTSLWRRCPV